MAGVFLTYLMNKINEKLHEIYPGSGVTRLEKTDFAAVDIHIEHLVIPDETEKIPREAFKGYRELVSVSVPSSIKEIGELAFADCEKLESVTLHEGLMVVGDNAFTGCSSLKSIVIPDSVKIINGAAFRNSGLTEPVLNASGEKLFYCPAAAACNEYKVPDGVRRIGRYAFYMLHDLNRIHFPKSLERIDRAAFVECGIESVILPRRFEKLEKGAFDECDALKSLSFEDGFDPVRAAVVRMNFSGVSFLAPTWLRLKQSDNYWESPDFLALAEKCASGSRNDMEQMADFFEKKSAAAPDEPFYTGAMNFWGYRAYENGSSIWRKRLEDYIKSVPDKRLPSVWLDEDLQGFADGKMLNAMGFMFFDPSREYNLAGLDDDGVVEVSSYESEDGPDEDGFGMETYYDWWYLDCGLCPVPGVDCFHSYSNIDRRIENVKKRFSKAHDTAAAAVMKECFRRGAALEQDGLLEEAFSLYKRAADSGSGDAMYAIGNLYLRKNFRSFKNILVGHVMPWDDIPAMPDTLSAFRWFMKAANAEIPDAMVKVGIMLSCGTGCKKDGEMSRKWLEKAADTGNQYAKKALHDFFDIPITDAVSDDAYDRMTDDFCVLAEVSDTKAVGLFENLMNGTDEQLSRFGLRLAERRYGIGGCYWDYAYPHLSKDRSCAPAVTIRCGWASAIVVNLRAFPDEGPILTFASDIGQDLVPVFGIRESGEQIEYDASEFGWLNHRRHARILRMTPGYVNEKASEELKYCGVDVPELLEHLKLTDHDALFIENGEKEYSVEIGHLVDNELRILLRYTVDGWDQGNGPAKTVLLSTL